MKAFKVVTEKRCKELEDIINGWKEHAQFLERYLGDRSRRESLYRDLAMHHMMELQLCQQRLMLISRVEADCTVSREKDLEKKCRALEEVSASLTAQLVARESQLMSMDSQVAVLQQEARFSVSTCKICFDREIRCMLVPCKHHAFCVPCAYRILESHWPICPICRISVDGCLETFSG